MYTNKSSQRIIIDEVQRIVEEKRLAKANRDAAIYQRFVETQRIAKEKRDAALKCIVKEPITKEHIIVKEEPITKEHIIVIEEPITKEEYNAKARRIAEECYIAETLRVAEQKRIAKEQRILAPKKARLDAIEKARLDAIEKARLDADTIEKARLDAIEKTRLDAIEKARLDAIEKARLDIDNINFVIFGYVYIVLVINNKHITKFNSQRDLPIHVQNYINATKQSTYLTKFDNKVLQSPYKKLQPLYNINTETVKKITKLIEDNIDDPYEYIKSNLFTMPQPESNDAYEYKHKIYNFIKKIKTVSSIVKTYIDFIRPYIYNKDRMVIIINHLYGILYEYTFPLCCLHIVECDNLREISIKGHILKSDSFILTRDGRKEIYETFGFTYVKITNCYQLTTAEIVIDCEHDNDIVNIRFDDCLNLKSVKILNRAFELPFYVDNIKYLRNSDYLQSFYMKRPNKINLTYVSFVGVQFN